MSVTLGIWKWRNPKGKKKPRAVMAQLAEDQPHEALDRFDMTAVVEALRQRFKLTGDDDPFIVDIHDYNGVPANWLFVSMGGTVDPDMIMDLTEFADDHGLYLHFET